MEGDAPPGEKTSSAFEQSSASWPSSAREAYGARTSCRSWRPEGHLPASQLVERIEKILR